MSPSAISRNPVGLYPESKSYLSSLATGWPIHNCLRKQKEGLRNCIHSFQLWCMQWHEKGKWSQLCQHGLPFTQGKRIAHLSWGSDAPTYGKSNGF
jgi:hypothetical protein